MSIGKTNKSIDFLSISSRGEEAAVSFAATPGSAEFRAAAPFGSDRGPVSLLPAPVVPDVEHGPEVPPVADDHGASPTAEIASSGEYRGTELAALLNDAEPSHDVGPSVAESEEAEDAEEGDHSASPVGVLASSGEFTGQELAEELHDLIFTEDHGSHLGLGSENRPEQGGPEHSERGLDLAALMAPATLPTLPDAAHLHAPIIG